MNEQLKQAIRDELVAFAWEDYGLDDAVSGRTTDWADNLAELIAQQVEPVWQQIEGERYGKCLTCGRLARWWDDPVRPSWVHVQPWAVENSHVPEVADA